MGTRWLVPIAFLALVGCHSGPPAEKLLRMCWPIEETEAGFRIVNRDFYVGGAAHGIEVVAPSYSCPEAIVIAEANDVFYPELFDLDSPGSFKATVTIKNLESFGRTHVIGELVVIENVSPSTKDAHELYLMNR